MQQTGCRSSQHQQTPQTASFLGAREQTAWHPSKPPTGCSSSPWLQEEHMMSQAVPRVHTAWQLSRLAKWGRCWWSRHPTCTSSLVSPRGQTLLRPSMQRRGCVLSASRHQTHYYGCLLFLHLIRHRACSSGCGVRPWPRALLPLTWRTNRLSPSGALGCRSGGQKRSASIFGRRKSSSPRHRCCWDRPWNRGRQSRFGSLRIRGSTGNKNMSQKLGCLARSPPAGALDKWKQNL